MQPSKATLSALAAMALGLSACAAGDEVAPTSAHGGGTLDGGGTGGQNTGGQGTGGNNVGGKDASGATGGAGTGGASLDANGADAIPDATPEDGADATVDATVDGTADAARDAIADASDSGDGGPPGNTGSLRCNGLGHVSVASSASLFIPGDWTMEAWFEDEAPNAGGGEFDHGGYSIMAKGNGPDAQFLADVAWESITTGQRVNWDDTANRLSYDMNANGYKHGAWIHMATTFVASSKTLTLYLNGKQVQQKTNVAAAAASNTNPLVLCGGIGGDWMGHIDDVRIWNVARTAGQISASYQTELVTLPASLVANWKFDDAATLGHDATGHLTDGTYTTGVSFSPGHP
jgi:hypothetical protein